MNVSGHRVGTAEIENALTEHKDVAESAVVGYPHELTGEGIFAFVVLKDKVTKNSNICNELKTLVKRKIASHAVPNKILVICVLIKRF